MKTTTTATDRLTRALDQRDQAERDLYAAVDDLRAEGESWATIGRALGVSRQSAWERYGDATGSSRPDWPASGAGDLRG